MTDLDMSTWVPAICIAIPATIAAFASLKNGRALKVTNGKKPGEYLESTAATVFNEAVKSEAIRKRLDDHMETEEAHSDQLREIVMDHVEADRIAFIDVAKILEGQGKIVSTLAAQDRAAELVSAALKLAASTVKHDLTDAAAGVKENLNIAAEVISSSTEEHMEELRHLSNNPENQ